MFRESPFGGDFLSPSHHTYDAVPSLEVPALDARLTAWGAPLNCSPPKAQVLSGPLAGIAGTVEKLEAGRALIALEGNEGVYIEVNPSLLGFVS